MIKKHIDYVDYDGTARSEDYYFNLSKAELTEMQLAEDGGLEKKIRTIIDTKDIPRIAAIFKDIILRSYGEKSSDGKRFIKSPELSTAFSQTEAYSNLYMELIQDEDKAADFVNGILPADIREQLDNKK